MPTNYSTLRAVNPLYTGFMATTAPNQAFVGRAATPRISVDCPAYIGQIFVDTHATFMGTPQSLVATPGAPLTKISTANPSLATYACVPYGVASNGITKLGAARSQLPEDLVQREFRALRAALDIAEEVRYAALYQTVANFTTTSLCTALPGGVQWSSVAATPLADLRSYINTIRKAGHGNMPNTIIIPYETMLAVGRSAELRGYAYFTGAGAVAANMSMGVDAVQGILARELGVNIVVPKGRNNTENFGQAHAEAEIWTDTVWVGCLMADSVAAGGTIRTVNTAVLGIDEISSIAEVGLGGVGNYGAGVDELAPSQGNAWIPYVQHSCVEKVISADLGGTITDCLA